MFDNRKKIKEISEDEEIVKLSQSIVQGLDLLTGKISEGDKMVAMAIAYNVFKNRLEDLANRPGMNNQDVAAKNTIWSLLQELSENGVIA